MLQTTSVAIAHTFTLAVLVLSCLVVLCVWAKAITVLHICEFVRVLVNIWLFMDMTYEMWICLSLSPLLKVWAVGSYASAVCMSCIMLFSIFENFKFDGIIFHYLFYFWKSKFVTVGIFWFFIFQFKFLCCNRLVVSLLFLHF